MNRHRLKYWFILFIILLLAGIARTINLSNLPAGFFCDEASVGYNAYTILTSGQDEYGNKWPVFFRAFGEFKNPLQIYSAVPLIAIFGLNEFAVRLTSVIYGLLGIWAIYLLTFQIFHHLRFKDTTSQTAALLGAAFLATSPWHLHISRTSLEGLTAWVFLITLGAYFWLKAFDKPRYLILAAICFGLSLYSYFPARLFTPPLVSILAAANWPLLVKNKPQVVKSLIAGMVIAVPLILFTLSPVGLSRWQQVSVFTNPPTDQSIATHILNNYFSHFSLEFLFLKGDSDMPGQFITRHSVLGFGQNYLWQLPLIIVGIFILIKKRFIPPLALIFAWLILYPVGSMFSLDTSAQATRSFIGVIPWQILTVIGIVGIWQYISKASLQGAWLGALALVIAFSFYSYAHQYFQLYPLYSADFWGWQYGPRPVINHFLTVQSSYHDLYLSGEFNGAQIFPKFYDPSNLCQSKCRIGDFFTQPQLVQPERKQLFALSPNYLEQSYYRQRFQINKTIYYPNGQPAFLIGEVIN